MSASHTIAVKNDGTRPKVSRPSPRVPPVDPAPELPISLVPLRSPAEMGEESKDYASRPGLRAQSSRSGTRAGTVLKVFGLSFLTASTGALVSIAVIRL